MLLKVSPEDEGWVLPGLGGVDLVGPVVLRDRDLHELEHKELNLIELNNLFPKSGLYLEYIKLN